MQLRANSLRHHLDKWKNIGASDFVFNCISEGVFWFKDKPPSFCQDNHSLPFTQACFVDNGINKVLNTGIIKEMNYNPLCVSPLGCVYKKGGKWRLTTDLRSINQYIDAPKFQYEGISFLKNIVKLKGKALRKHSLHEKTAASVLLKLFISGNEWCHTTDAPLAHERNSIFKWKHIHVHSMIPEDQKIWLHNDVVRGDFLQPPHRH